MNLLDYICVVVLTLSTYMQFRTNLILANLRKDRKGVVVSKEYKIPEGELFNYITAPLQLMEIIVYLCLSIIVRKALTFHFATLLVVINQVSDI